jgi:hypothetical protein
MILVKQNETMKVNLKNSLYMVHKLISINYILSYKTKSQGFVVFLLFQTKQHFSLKPVLQLSSTKHDR